MRRFVRLSTCSALALGIASGPALAELTASEVWDGLESSMQGFGYSVTGTETPTSDGLEVSDVEMRLEAPEDNSTFLIEIGTIDLTENDDGSVSIVFPAAMPITIDAAPEDDDAVNMVLIYGNDGLELNVSGEPDNMTYDYTANQLTLSLDALTVNGEPISREDGQFEFVMDDVSGTTVVAGTEETQITQDVRAGTASYDVSFLDPEGGGRGLINGAMDSFYISSTATLPAGFDSSAPESLSLDGFSAGGAMGYTNGRTQFSAEDEMGTTTGTTKSGSVSLEFVLSDEALRYDVSATEQAFAISGPEMPVPLDVSMSGSSFNVEIPVAAAEEPQDMALGLSFRGFEMSDVLWNMLDPAATLPRDPATIVLDLTGMVTPSANLFDPTEMARFENSDEPPGELNSITLNDLTIEAAGARLGGSGSFTFDNTDLQTFDGFPRPTGQVDVTLTGANTLIDKLIEMGMLTEEDAMGARMMMSMFAVPGDGPDVLNSTLQINEQGHVLANGMRIQ